MNILIIEDDLVLSNGLTHSLNNSGYHTQAANSGTAALKHLQASDFDLIILDLGLPDMDGLELLRRLRKQKISLPILILTARDGVNDRIQGISQGADDYLSKPFDLGELEARIQALIRRCYGGFDQLISIGQLSFNTQTRELLAQEEPLALSIRELALLELLLLQSGKVVCKDRISQRLASDGDALADNAIEVAIHRLRKRIEPHQVLIRTVRGLGYLLEANNNGL